MADEKRAQEVLAKVNEWRQDAFVAGQWGYMAQEDPDYAEALDKLYRHIMSKEGALPVKTKETIMVVMLANRTFDRTAAHMERAMDAGATRQELLEALEVAQMITGAPTLLFGVDVLEKIVAKRRAEGRSI